MEKELELLVRSYIPSGIIKPIFTHCCKSLINHIPHNPCTICKQPFYTFDKVTPMLSYICGNPNDTIIETIYNNIKVTEDLYKLYNYIKTKTGIVRYYNILSEQNNKVLTKFNELTYGLVQKDFKWDNVVVNPYDSLFIVYNKDIRVVRLCVEYVINYINKKLKDNMPYIGIINNVISVYYEGLGVPIRIRIIYDNELINSGIPCYYNGVNVYRLSPIIQDYREYGDFNNIILKYNESIGDFQNRTGVACVAGLNSFMKDILRNYKLYIPDRFKLTKDMSIVDIKNTENEIALVTNNEYIKYKGCIASNSDILSFMQKHVYKPLWLIRGTGKV